MCPCSLRTLRHDNGNSFTFIIHYLVDSSIGCNHSNKCSSIRSVEPTLLEEVIRVSAPFRVYELIDLRVRGSSGQHSGSGVRIRSGAGGSVPPRGTMSDAGGNRPPGKCGCRPAPFDCRPSSTGPTGPRPFSRFDDAGRYRDADAVA